MTDYPPEWVEKIARLLFGQWWGDDPNDRFRTSADHVRVLVTDHFEEYGGGDKTLDEFAADLLAAIVPLVRAATLREAADRFEREWDSRDPYGYLAILRRWADEVQP